MTPADGTQVPVTGVPRVAIVVLTYRCNSRCNMCSIWEDHTATHLPLATLERVFSEPFVAEHLRSINLTGGELFLRKDISEVHAVLVRNCSSLQSITINTNATLPERVVQTFQEILAAKSMGDRVVQTSCFISLDGTEAVHDRVRGVAGGYRKVLHTIGQLQDLGKGAIDVGVNFTITRHNFMDMEAVADIARQLDLELSYTLAMRSEMYFQNAGMDFAIAPSSAQAEVVATTLRNLLASHRLPDPARYYESLIGMLRGSPRSIGCIFKEDGFFLDPRGDVYPCWGHEQRIGSVKDASLTSLWHGHRSHEVRMCIAESCARCPNNCYIKYQRLDRLRHLLDTAAAQSLQLASGALS